MTDYIQPELLILIPVLYSTGESLKLSKMISNKYIPIILGIIGIILSFLYLASEYELSIKLAFSAITQGILCAAASVYTNQIYKQIGKDK